MAKIMVVGLDEDGDLFHRPCESEEDLTQYMVDERNQYGIPICMTWAVLRSDTDITFTALPEQG